ncbi:MAG: hypothetical protein QE284_12115 [Rhizobium sp.]|nr:hypothetical protein [Rhizobium sp.]
MSASGNDAAGRVSISSLDTNGDGIISAEELEAAKSARTQDPTVATNSAASGAQSQLQSSVISMLLQSSVAQTGGEWPSDARDLLAATDADGERVMTSDDGVTGLTPAPQPIDGGVEAGAEDDTVSIFDILAEMQRVIDAYRENDGETSRT